VDNDQQFLTQLQLAVDRWGATEAVGAAQPGEWESFGWSDVWATVREGAGRTVGLPARVAGSAVVAASRSKLHGHLARFMGDIFVYLDERGDRTHPGPIPQIVIDAVAAAIAARTHDDPHVVIVGHSMGGNIVYDVLTHYRPDLEIDVLVTVGSQVGMFEEFKIFHESDEAVPVRPGDRVAKPANIKQWINVFDKQDILSFVAGKVFSGVEDFEYSTGASALGAHTSYFKRPSFHKRLNERLRKHLSP
jgi:pimeloyl-ACP methyl ester carboxylesterase